MTTANPREVFARRLKTTKGNSSELTRYPSESVVGGSLKAAKVPVGNAFEKDDVRTIGSIRREEERERDGGVYQRKSFS